MPGSSCDLSSLDPLCNDSEEILRQLVENPFDVDSFFTEFNGADVKVRINWLHFLHYSKLRSAFRWFYAKKVTYLRRSSYRLLISININNSRFSTHWFSLNRENHRNQKCLPWIMNWYLSLLIFIIFALKMVNHVQIENKLQNWKRMRPFSRSFCFAEAENHRMALKRLQANSTFASFPISVHTALSLHCMQWQTEVGTSAKLLAIRFHMFDTQSCSFETTFLSFTTDFINSLRTVWKTFFYCKNEWIWTIFCWKFSEMSWPITFFKFLFLYFRFQRNNYANVCSNKKKRSGFVFFLHMQI